MLQLNDLSAKLLLDEANAVALRTCRRLRLSAHDVVRCVTDHQHPLAHGQLAAVLGRQLAGAAGDRRPVAALDAEAAPSETAARPAEAVPEGAPPHAAAALT